MQREIKFRAWGMSKTMRSWEELKPLHVSTIFSKSVGYHLMQYTGLKDKNGNEIYEGDIVMLGGSKEPKVMEFKGGSFILGHIYHGTEAYRMEIIGNIYEHPDLLK